MRKIILAAFAAIQFGCAMKVVRDDTSAAGETREYQLSSLLLAFIPIVKLPPANEMCPGGYVQALDLGMETSQVLLTAVTVGIFVPYKATVTCSKAAEIRK